MPPPLPPPPPPPTPPTPPQVIRFAHNGKSKGYGFVSFGDQAEGATVIKEMNGKYVGEWRAAHVL